ncbi:Aldo/keto reductase, partial [Meredithblackwellia eburnea MCA 4105]
QHYSQRLVGDALQVLQDQHGVKREDLRLQTKFTLLDGQDLNKSVVALRLRSFFGRAGELSRGDLRTTYLDLLVLHSPMEARQKTLIVWKEFGAFVKSGKVRQLGISNIYDPEELEWAFQTFDIKPSLQTKPLSCSVNFGLPVLEICQKYGAQYQSFWSLTANPKLLSSLQLQALAAKDQLTSSQALFKCLVSTEKFGKGTIVPLNGTKDVTHMKQDL